MTDDKGRDLSVVQETDQSLRIEIKFSTSRGEFTLDNLLSGRPTVLESSLTRTDLKIREAEYFLHLLGRFRFHEGALLFHLSAFLSSLRSVTFVLQKEGQGPLFDAWYAGERGRLESNDLLRTLKDLRNEALKEGLEAPRISLGPLLRFRGNELAVTYTIFSIEIGGRLFQLDDLKHALEEVKAVVEEAKSAGVLIGGIQRKTTFVTQIQEWDEEQSKWLPMIGVPPVQIVAEMSREEPAEAPAMKWRDLRDE